MNCAFVRSFLSVVAAGATIAAAPTATARIATHCKVGHEYSTGGTNEIRWKIVPINNLSDLVSGTGYHYQVVETLFSSLVKSPSLKIDKNDLLFTTENNKYLDLSHATGFTMIPTQVSHSTLTVEPTHKLWASGHAQIDTKGGKRVGDFYVYLREDRKPCMHSKVQVDPATGQKPACRRLLIEYFDDNDTYSTGDRPQMNVNVNLIGQGKCAGNLQETSDGEGDVGPN